MKAKDLLKYVATPSRVVVTIVIMLFLVCMLELLAMAAGYGVYEFFGLEEQRVHRPQRRIGSVSEEELTEEEEKRLSRLRIAQKHFLPDSTIHLTVKKDVPESREFDSLDSFRRRPRRRQPKLTTTEVYDANNNLIWQGRSDETPYEYLLWTKRPGRRFRYKNFREMHMITPEFSQTLEMPVYSETGGQLWRYLPDSDVFVGYDTGRGKIGYIGAAGFAESKSSAEPFGKFRLLIAWIPKDADNRLMLWQTDTRIYEINFEKQQVHIIFDSPQSPIKWLRQLNWDLSQQQDIEPSIQYRPLLHCLTKDGKLHLLLREPEQRVTINIPEDWWADAVTVTATEDNIFLLRRDMERRAPKAYAQPPMRTHEWRRQFESRASREWIELYSVDGKGNLELVNQLEWTHPPIRLGRLSDRFDPPAYKRVTKAFATPLYNWLWDLAPKELLLAAYESIETVRDVMNLIEETRGRNDILNWAVSLVMVAVAFWHGWARRRGWGRLVFWLVFVGLFNLAGLLAYLALNHSTVIKCPVCGKGRGLVRFDCARCGEELPRPIRGELDLIFEG